MSKFTHEELENLKNKIINADEDKWYQIYYILKNLPKKQFTLNSNGLLFDLMKFDKEVIDSIKNIINK